MCMCRHYKMNKELIYSGGQKLRDDRGFKKMADRNGTISIVLKTRFLIQFVKYIFRNIQQHSNRCILHLIVSLHLSVFVSPSRLKISTLSEHVVDSCFEGIISLFCKRILKTFIIQNLQQIGSSIIFKGKMLQTTYPHSYDLLSAQTWKKK